MADPSTLGRLSRRRFLAAGAAGMLVPAALAAETRPAGAITIGVFSDAHFADREPAGSRHYRDSAAKLAEFVRAMNEAKPAFAIGLGDLVDKGRTLAEETAYLERIEGVYREFRGPRHRVIGNHDVATFTKAQFVAATGMPGPNYAFDVGGYHFIVLDACYRKDGTPYSAGNFDWQDSAIPPAELKWLADDLRRAGKPSVLFCHQRLDDDKNIHTVRNAPQVRAALDASGSVLAVFSGHDHGGGYTKVAGIHYVTMRGMVEGPGSENNAFALVSVSPKGIDVRGFGKQPSRKLT